MTTPLDHAFRTMAEDDREPARRRYFSIFVNTELFVLLAEGTPEADIVPQRVDLDGAPYVMAFDKEVRMAQFLDGPQNYAVLSGRALVAALSGQAVGIGVNLGSETAFLLPPDVLVWLDDAATAPVLASADRYDAVAAPTGAPADLISLLDTHLPVLSGRAQAATLFSGRQAGEEALVLAIEGTPPPARAAAAGALASALRVAGVTAALDLMFVDPGSQIAARLAKVGLRFDIPPPAPAITHRPPGSDPDTPPRLQ